MTQTSTPARYIVTGHPATGETPTVTLRTDDRAAAVAEVDDHGEVYSFPVLARDTWTPGAVIHWRHTDVRGVWHD